MTSSRCTFKTLVLLGFCAVATAVTVPAQADQNDPLVTLYVFPGVFDDASPSFQGVATVVSCTNFSSKTERIQFVLFNRDGSIVSNQTALIENLQTVTAGTHPTNLYLINLLIDPTAVPVRQGFIGIQATSPAMVCTAQVVDAAALVPSGIHLHGVRYNAVPGSQE